MPQRPTAVSDDHRRLRDEEEEERKVAGTGESRGRMPQGDSCRGLFQALLAIAINRYGLTNEDLNRRWSNPNRMYHPVIYHTKGLMEYCARVLQRPPHVFVDYHGHSRRKNVFLFGCSRSGSWSVADRAKPDQPVQYLMLPHLMQRTSSAFALQLCSFKIERNKESTARVAVWRQLGVSRSYTMESSFCGCDQGILAGLHLDTEHLKTIGRDFCQALSMMKDGGDDWAIGKIPVGKHIPVESGCMDNDVSSSSESHDSDFET